MKKSQDSQILSGQELRAEAEQRLAKAPPETSKQSVDDLLHELQVHQIELEMQNEALRESQRALEASRDRYVDLYEFAPVGYLTLTGDGQIDDINLTGAALLGLDRKKLLRRRFDLYVTEKDREHWRRLFVRAVGSETRQQVQLEMQRGDGKVFQASLDYVRIADEDVPDQDVPTGLRVALADISERRHAEEELRIAAIAFESQQGMVVTDAHGVIVRVNHAFSELSGYAASEVVGSTPPLLKTQHQDTAFYQHLRAELKSNHYWQGEIWSRCKGGAIYALWMTITAVFGPDGEVTHYIGAFSNITTNKEAEVEIHRLAFYDPLTRLPNRRLAYDRIGQAMAASGRTGHYGALLFLDLDNLKQLNDTRGHDAGDKWLIETARRLHSEIREQDTVARLGGDEFVVMLEGLSSKSEEAAVRAGLISESLREAIAIPYDLGNFEHRGACSIGVSLFRDHEFSVEELFKHADMALYQAKNSGRNTIRFFDPAMQLALEDRNTLETELHQALARKQFQLYYLAQVDETRHIVGAEVLLRWEHPQHGMLPHADFIQMAEEAGLILPIGRWVLQTACAQLRAWQDDPVMREMHISVNISGLEIRHPGFVDEVQSVLNESGAGSDKLKLEITESSMLIDIDETATKMRALKDEGVDFSMDDFGTGYSSLSYLQRLPLHQLKIDSSFVSKITSDINSAAIAKTIICMGRTLGLDVIAEGVEHEEQFNCLRECGCNAFQGFLFSRPLPLSEFEEFVQGKK